MVFSCPHDLKLGYWTLFRMYIRSFFSQGSFSVRYRQNIGFLFCLEPAGRKIWKKDEDLKKFYLRHLEYYNGNPFMVTLVLGAVARMEERLRDNEGIAEEDVNRFKTAVGQAIGAVGDRFFWRALRPFSLVLGLLCAYLIGVWGALVFLVMFNLPVLYLRWYWLIRGYTLGQRVVIEIKNPKIDQAANVLEAVGGMALALLIVGFLGAPDYSLSWISVETVGLFCLSFVVLQGKFPPSVFFIIFTALAVLLGRLTVGM